MPKRHATVDFPGLLPQLLREERGALLVEYLVVTSAGLMIAVALSGLGIQLVGSFMSSLSALYSQYP